MRVLLLLLLSSVFLSGCATTPAPGADTALLEAAIGAAGGENNVTRTHTLHWTGEATVFAGERRIEYGRPYFELRLETFEALP